MKITMKELKEKSFFVPLTANGQWADYKNFTALQWKENLINVLRLVIATHNPTMNKSQLNQLAQQQLDNFISSIVANISPERPCLALAFAPAQCWFIAFVVDAFLPLEKIHTVNIFTAKGYAEHAQAVEIIKAKGDPLLFALELINNLD